MVALILVDSNVWIFESIEIYPEFSAARAALREAAKSDMLATNAIIASEVYHKLYRLAGTAAAKRRVKKILENELVRYLPVTAETASQAVGLAASRKLRINDALIAQQAVDEKAAVLTDDVRHFKKVPRLKVTALR